MTGTAFAILAMFIKKVQHTLERASTPVHHPRCIIPGASPPVHHHLSGSLWLSLTPYGMWLSLALYCSPNLLPKPLLGSQSPCSARNVVPEFQHYMLVCLPTYLPTDWSTEIGGGDAYAVKNLSIQDFWYLKNLPG